MDIYIYIRCIHIYTVYIDIDIDIDIAAAKSKKTIAVPFNLSYVVFFDNWFRNQVPLETRKLLGCASQLAAG